VAKVELVVDLTGGEQVRVATGPHWKGCHGPVRSGDLLGGEVYDASHERPGWTEPGYDDSQWEHAWPDPGPSGRIVDTPCEPVRVVKEVEPVAVLPGRPGKRIFDLGEQVVGWPRLTVAAVPGTVVRLRCAEALDAAGELWSANLRGAACTDTYLACAAGRQTWEPRSTYRGFRYVEVTGPPDTEVTGVVAHSDVRPTGDFSCSSPDLAALWEAVRRTVRANLVSLPTDCPQRDERLGWLADAEVTLETASYLFDVGQLFAGWLADVRSGQSPDGAFPDVAPRLAHTGDGAPGWGDAGVAVPWGLWQWYGDRQVLADNLEAMARWPEWIAAANPDGVWRHGRGRDYGDWLSPVETPKQLLATAWWARSCELVAASADVVGRDDLRRLARSLQGQVRDGFAREWADPDQSQQQTGLLLGLAFGLLPDVDAARRRLIADVEERGMTTGFQGVRHLLPQLTAAGRTDLAYAVALSEGSPGWMSMLRQGATSIWERWDARTADGFADPFLNSLCHSALGTVATWLHATVGGLTRHPGVVGWRRALVEPEPGGGVHWAQTTYDSRLGVYAVEWELVDEVLEVHVEVPVGGEALLRVAGELVAPVPGVRTYLGRTTGLLPAGRWTARVRQEFRQQRRTLDT
jgi:alpha-L-rhamnosidase